MIAMLITTVSIALMSQPKPRPAAMVLDLKGHVEVKTAESASRPAAIGELLYPGEHLVNATDGAATVAILGAGAQETLKPSVETTVGAGGCTPPDAVARLKQQPKAVANTMKGLRPAAGDPRVAGVGFRSGPEEPTAITPILGATVDSVRPGLAWPPAAKVATYRVKLLSGAGRELWRAETNEPRIAYPADKEPLQPGYLYRWEVTDSNFRKLASGEFSVATSSEREQLAALKNLADSGDRADRLAAALSYRGLAAYAEAIAVYERLARDDPGEVTYQSALGELYRQAGRPGARGAAHGAK